jgi:flagellar biosynthetic protein FlhB
VAWSAVRPVATATAVFAGGVLLVAVLANFVQVGAVFAPKRVRPDGGRLSPGAGLKRLFSLRSTIRVLLGLARIATVAVVVWLSAGSMWHRVLGTAALAPADLAAEAGRLAWTLGLRLALALAVLGVLDLLYQRWQHRRDLRMTRREVLEDLRRMQGNPATTARRRRGRKQAARKHSLPPAPVRGLEAAVNRT